MSSAVEWMLHACVTLGWLDDDEFVPTQQLAQWFDLPPEYLKKQLQRLVRAGILESVPGALGGFRLNGDPRSISIMDVVTAVEGPTFPFVCTDVRQRGQSGQNATNEFMSPCGISLAIRKAELSWRRELASQSVAGLMNAAPKASVARTQHGLTRGPASN
jgi:Rrf2 family protein